MKNPVRVKITKKRHNLLVFANKCVSNIDSVKFCYADINCRLNIKREDELINDTLLYFLTELNSHVDGDEWKFEKIFVLLWTASATLSIMVSKFFSSGCVCLNLVSWNCFFSWIHSEYCMKSWEFFWSYFPAFGLNTERYTVSLRIQSECGKLQTRKTVRTLFTQCKFYLVSMWCFKLRAIRWVI